MMRLSPRQVVVKYMAGGVFFDELACGYKESVDSVTRARLTKADWR
jgi:hypothetical protein